MSAQVPNSRPGITREKIEKIAAEKSLTSKVYLVGIRGYYEDSMGKPNENDIGTYDDALILVSPDDFRTFNANVDPSVQRYHMANLIEGLWKYKVGTHGLSKPAHLQYDALVQADEVTVKRTQLGNDEGYFGINIHRGGSVGTSSLGCQTVPPSQWDEFIRLVKQELKQHGQTVLPYLLVNNKGNLYA